MAPNPDTIKALATLMNDRLAQSDVPVFSADELLSAVCTLTLSTMIAALLMVADHPAAQAVVRQGLQGMLYQMLAHLADDTPGRVM